MMYYLFLDDSSRTSYKTIWNFKWSLIVFENSEKIRVLLNLLYLTYFMAESSFGQQRVAVEHEGVVVERFFVAAAESRQLL